MGVVVLQRLGSLSYFAGAEKKDDRVLVPDLGSLTSIYDRWVLLIEAHSLLYVLLPAMFVVLMFYLVGF